MPSQRELFAAAQSHHMAGRLEEARGLYQTIIESDPNHADAWHLMGTAMAQQGLGAEGVEHIRQATRLAPGRAPYLNNLGVVLQDLGRLDEALEAFGQATVLEHGNSDAPYNMAKLCKLMGRPQEALEGYERVLEIDPGRTDAVINLANLLFEGARPDEAVALYTRAGTQARDDHERARALINEGNAYRRMGWDDEALDAYQKALVLEPHDGLAIKQALTVPVIPWSRDHIEELRTTFEARIDKLLEGSALAVEDPALETSTTTFFLAYHAMNDKALQEKVARLHLAACPELGFVAPHCKAPPINRQRIRLGMISAYFHLHSIGRLNQELIVRLGRGEIELTVFTMAGQDDEVSRKIKEAAERVVQLPDGLWEARQRIADEKLDILFYTDLGMDIRTYFLAFARLARVQCVSWGHPDTTGIPAIDYFISSELTEPDGAEAHYSEQLYRLATLPTVYGRPEAEGPAKGREQFGFPAGANIYLCPQMAIKFHPDLDQIAGRILADDPQAHFVLLEGAVSQWTDRVMERMKRTLPDHHDRVRLIPRVAPGDYLHLLATADVILDTPHFSGGNTSYESFAMNKPVVTLAGEFMRGRVTLAQYRMMGIEDFIADNLEEFSAIALRLGTDAGYRTEMETRIAEASPCLFDEDAALEEFEKFFKWAVSLPNPAGIG